MTHGKQYCQHSSSSDSECVQFFSRKSDSAKYWYAIRFYCLQKSFQSLLSCFKKIEEIHVSVFEGEYEASG